MGKKKQSKKDRVKEELKYRMGLHHGLDKDTNKAMERYGIDRTKYASSGAISQGRVHGKESYKQMEKDLLQAARSDYHTNRAIEASAMAGNKRAQKFAENGIRDVRALMHVQDMQGKQHKRLVGGGDFASPSDYAGLSYALVQKDRDKQTEGYRDEFASKDALADLEDKLSKGGEVDEEFVPEKSEQTLKDEAVVNWWDEEFATGGIYGDDSNKGPGMSSVYEEYGSPLLQPMMNKREADEKSAANKFLDAYKKDLFQGGAALMPEF